MTEAEKETIPNLLKTLIPLSQSLSTPLLTIASTNPLGCPVLRDLASDISTTTSVLSTLQTTHSKYPLPSTIPALPILLRCLEREFKKIEKVLSEIDEEENDNHEKKWNAKGRGKGIGDPRQVAIQEGMRDIGPLGKVMGTIEDTMDSLAVLGVMGKLKVLLEVPEEKRDGEQKREIKMVMKQYDLDLVKRQSRTISRLAKLALREESASKRANDDSDTIVVKQDFFERPSSDVEIETRSIQSFDSNGSDQFIDSPEVYEYWVLQKIEGETRVRSTWKFLGLKAKEMMEDTTYTIEGRAKSQAEMKAKYEETRTEEEYHTREKEIRKTISSLPYRFQNELLLLLQDRERMSSNMRFSREWNIVDIEPLKPRITTQAKSWGAWWKGVGGINQWGCIIKGETSSKQEAGSDLKVPDRYLDPFRRRNDRRPIIVERDIERSRFPEDDIPFHRRPVQSYPAPAYNGPRWVGPAFRVKEPTEEMYKKEVERMFEVLAAPSSEDQVKVEEF